MDKSKNSLITSKSSNGSAAKLRTRRDKKSKSNAEIALKKSGVYVEKKPTKILSDKPSDIAPNRLKCASRPGKKQFLNSVLDILSTNTAVTQYADSNDPNTTTNSGNNNKKKKPQYVDDSISPKRKPKYKSRIYNGFQNEMDDFITQHSMNIKRSQSNNSESSQNDPADIKWSDFLPRLVPKTDSDIEDEKLLKMAQQSANESKKDENNLYNFFFDLLQNTFNVNKGKNADTTQATRASSPQNVLEINMALDNNIDIENSKYTSDDFAYTGQRNKFGSGTPHHRWDETIIDDTDYKTLPNRKRKIKSTSFVNNKKIPTQLTTRSFIYQKPSEYSKKTLNNDRKQNLLNSLKEQLSITKNKFSEPQNFYQALQLMAKNKRREKSIRFDEPAKEIKEGDVFKSIFRRHQLQSPTRKTNKRLSMPLTSKFNRSYPQKSTINTKNPLAYIVEDNRESRHSLRVYAYNIEDPTERNVTVPTYQDLGSDISNSEIPLYLSDDSSVFEDNVMNINGKRYPF